MRAVIILLALAMASCSAYSASDEEFLIDDITVDSEDDMETEAVRDDASMDLIENAPEFFETRYSVFGYWRSYEDPDYIETARDYVFLNGSVLTEDDYTYTIADGIRTIRFDTFIDQADQFFFRNTVFVDRFGIDLQNMSMDDLRIFADIVTRYPAESMTVLLIEYGV